MPHGHVQTPRLAPAHHKRTPGKQPAGHIVIGRGDRWPAPLLIRLKSPHSTTFAYFAQLLFPIFMRPSMHCQPCHPTFLCILSTHTFQHWLGVLLGTCKQQHLQQSVMEGSACH